MAMRADAVVAVATRPSLRGGWLIAAALAAAGVAALATVGAPSDTFLVPIAIFAVAAAELLTLDFPDRRGVSVAALPVLLAAAAGGDSAAVWAAAIGTALASIGHRRPVARVLFLFGRAALAATAAGAATALITPGSLGQPDPAAAAPGALCFVAAFAGLSEVASWVERRALGPARSSQVDLLVSIGLVPVALAAWALEERAGPQGLLAGGGGLLAVLAVIRSAVNLSTHHADLRQLYELAREVQASGSPEASAAALARGLPRWVPFDELALLLPHERGLRVVSSRGTRMLPRDWTPRPELESLAADGPVTAPPMLLPLPRGAHALVAQYGQRGVLVLARRRTFRADERAALGLLLTQLSAALEQVRLLDEIDRERERLAVLLASSGEGIFVLDGDGNVARVNDALRGMTGLSDAEAVGRPIDASLSFHDRSEVPLAALLNQVRPGAPLMTEGLLTGRDGRERDVLLSFSAIAQAEDRTGGIGIVRDVTAMKGAQRERDDFINVMTHDLRQPLAGILGYAQLLERALQTGGAAERLIRYATGVREGGDRMLRMINNLLELARMESGRVQIEVTRLEPAPLIEEVIRDFDPQASEKRLTIQLESPGGVPSIETSEPLLRESVANLVGNAVKYTPDGGSVTVSLHTGESGITIAVRDTGIGIPADALPRIFTRFFRTGQSEVRQIRGSGLGLALTKMMIERIGGSVTVESELGRGTTFTVRVPSVMPTLEIP